MSEINLDFTVANINSTIVVDDTNINIVSEPILLTIYSSSAPGAATEVNANIANVHIYGGTNGYVLQTDGTGNLTWTAQTGGGGGNGSPGGSNTQIQYNDSGSFGGNVGFTFNELTGDVNIPNNVIAANITGTVLTSVQPYIQSVGSLVTLNVTGNITSANINAGNLAVANFFSGSGSLLYGINASNITSGALPSFLSPKQLLTNFNVAGTPSTQTLTDESLNFVFTNNYQPGNISITTTSINPGNLENWYDVAYGDGKYIAVSYYNSPGGSTTFSRSTDGLAWTTFSVGQQANWYAIAYGNNKFVALSPTHSAVSSDGISWIVTALPIDQQIHWHSIAYGNGIFVAVGGTQNGASSSETNKAIYSGDGITWTTSTLPQSKTWTGITYGDGIYVAVSYHDTGASNVSAYSTDGITWTQTTLPAAAYWTDVTFGNGAFIAIAAQFISTAQFAVSFNGATWTSITAPWPGNWDSAAYGNGIFVAKQGWAGTLSTIYGYSFDGISWTIDNFASNVHTGGITYGANGFVTVSGFGADSYNMTFASTLASYNIYLPGHSNYPSTSFIWTAQPVQPTVATQVNSLGNAIVSRRPTYTYSVVTSNTANVDTNSVGKIPNTTMTTLQASANGNMTLSMTKGGGDCLFVTDTVLGQNYGISANTGTTSTYYYAASLLSQNQLLTNYQSSVKNTSNTKTQLTFECLQTNQLTPPTINVLSGTGSTLTANTQNTKIIQ